MRSAIVDRPLDAPALVGEVSSAGCGAVVLFVGTVRDSNDGRAVAGIEYSSYRAMAEREFRAILDEAAARFPARGWPPSTGWARSPWGRPAWRSP